MAITEQELAKAEARMAETRAAAMPCPLATIAAVRAWWLPSTPGSS